MKRKFIKKIAISLMTTLIITSMYTISASAKWVKDSKDNWSWNQDGTNAVGWKLIDSKWYNFNESGHMSIGWINDNGLYYFTNSSGEMQTGNVKIDGKMYTFSNGGAMLYSDSISVKNTNSYSTIGYVATNSDSLNVRLDATLSSDIIGTVANGSEIKITDNEKDGFYPIIFNDKKGWVSSQWISFNKINNTSIQTIINQPVTYSNTIANVNIPPI